MEIFKNGFPYAKQTTVVNADGSRQIKVQYADAPFFQRIINIA